MILRQSKIQQGFLKDGYELISEALNLLNNVYGAMHPEIAQCLRMLARFINIFYSYFQFHLSLCFNKILYFILLFELREPFVSKFFRTTTYLSIYQSRLNYIMGDLVEALSCQQKGVLMSLLSIYLYFYLD